MKKIIIGGIIVVIGLFIWGRTLQEGNITYFKETPVACLPNGHQNIAVHIHPRLSIVVDGESEIIPANVGITDTCMSEIHTHDASGEIHVETVTASRLSELTLADFFVVWNKSVEREGYTLEIRQDGIVQDRVEDAALIDGSQIEFIYTSIAGDI